MCGVTERELTHWHVSTLSVSSVCVCVCVSETGVYTRRVMRQCSSVGVLVLVVSACCMLLLLLATFCFQLLSPDSPWSSGVKRGAECVSLLSRYIASPPPRSRTRLRVVHMVTGPSRLQAKLYGISEQQWAPETRHAGPSVSGNALLPVNHCPSYGQIDPTMGK